MCDSIALVILALLAGAGFYTLWVGLNDDY